VSNLWARAVGARWETVEQMLKFQPTDGKTWQEVHDNYDWDHPKMKEFVKDVANRGVKSTIEVDYEKDPPTVEDGHTRVLAAQKAGLSHVPTRQYEHWDARE
jgi:hypothetical protein